MKYRPKRYYLLGDLKPLNKGPLRSNRRRMISVWEYDNGKINTVRIETESLRRSA